MKVILLAPPGGGKGTVSEKLAKEFSLQHISAGELLREEVASKGKIGQKIKPIIEKGELVPDHLVIEIIRLVISKIDGFVLDGFPRTIPQAQEIQDLNIDVVIYLEIAEDVAVKRISGRLVCKNSEHTYHVTSIPPRRAGFCDVDGHPLLQREDDREEVVRKRFKIYEEKTQPLIDYYKNKGLLVAVNGIGTPEEVYRRVKAIVKKRSQT